MSVITISLVHKYETHLYSGDYSNGTFFEGAVTVPESQVDDIFKKFKEEGIIELGEYKNRYRPDNFELSDLTKIEFLNKDPAKNFQKHFYTREDHVFGEGFVYRENGDKGYKYFYWLTTLKKEDYELSKEQRRKGCF